VFDRYVALMQREARAEARRHHQHQHWLAGESAPRSPVG
jgi:hypothetical protein